MNRIQDCYLVRCFTVNPENNTNAMISNTTLNGVSIN